MVLVSAHVHLQERVQKIVDTAKAILIRSPNRVVMALLAKVYIA